MNDRYHTTSVTAWPRNEAMFSLTFKVNILTVKQYAPNFKEDLGWFSAFMSIRFSFYQSQIGQFVVGRKT